MVLPLGVCFAVVTPPGQVADEPAHVIREQGLLHGALIGQRMSVAGVGGRAVLTAGVYADPGPLEASFLPGTPYTVPSYAMKAGIPWANSEIFMQIAPVAIYFPIFYVPAALGIGVAHFLGVSPYRSMLAGRFVALLAYTLIGVLALGIATRGQAMMFLALAMPLSVSLGASCDPDGLLIATTAFGCALATRGRGWPAAVCLAAVIAVKPPYAPIALALALPWQGIGRWRRRSLLIGAAILPGLCWFIYAMLFVAAPSTRAAYHPGLLWPGDPHLWFYATAAGAQFKVVLAHPVRIAVLIWQSIVGNMLLVREAIGILGWLSIPLPAWVYTLWMVAAGAALVADCFGPADSSVDWWGTPILLSAVIATVILVWLSQYLTWTEVGMAEIDGPTGRYLLPLLPLLSLAAPRLGGRHQAAISALASCVPIVAATVSLAILPAYLAAQFAVR